MKCFLRRTIYGLAADDEDGEDALRGIKLGEYVECNVTKHRNVKFHRLFFVMCGKLARALGVKSKQVVDVLKIRTGYYTPIETRDGVVFKIPDSIAFHNMDEVRFREFFDDCCREICTAWLPHMTPGRWRAEVLQMMGINWDEVDGTEPLHESRDGEDTAHQREDARPPHRGR